MPELAEVEFIRKTWDPGLGQPIAAVELHHGKRIFRGSDEAALIQTLTGARLQHSEARGKQMLFQFSRGGWLGIHLGMSGELRREAPGYEPQKHDHLVFRQRKQTLVFRDPRMFGRVRFAAGKTAPEWWSALPPALTSKEWTVEILRAALARRKRSPLKGVLLMQELFPGVGNWMADEILWQARLHPKRPAGDLTAAESRRLWEKVQMVCRVSLETIGADWGDVPDDWLFHVRWKKGGICPRHGIELCRATVAGRTTAWCPRCQGK